MIDEDLAHDVGSRSQEMRAATVVGLVLFDEAGVSFVDEGGWLEGMARMLVAEIAPGQSLEFGIDEGNEPIEGVLVTVSKTLKEEGDRLVREHGYSFALYRGIWRRWSA